MLYYNRISLSRVLSLFRHMEKYDFFPTEEVNNNIYSNCYVII